jgi:hypothetical protein
MLTLHKGSPAKVVARSAWSLAGQYYTAAERTKTGHSEIPYESKTAGLQRPLAHGRRPRRRPTAIAQLDARVSSRPR